MPTWIMLIQLGLILISRVVERWTGKCQIWRRVCRVRWQGQGRGTIRERCGIGRGCELEIIASVTVTVTRVTRDRIWSIPLGRVTIMMWRFTARKWPTLTVKRGGGGSFSEGGEIQSRNSGWWRRGWRSWGGVVFITMFPVFFMYTEWFFIIWSMVTFIAGEFFISQTDKDWSVKRGKDNEKYTLPIYVSLQIRLLESSVDATDRDPWTRESPIKYVSITMISELENNRTNLQCRVRIVSFHVTVKICLPTDHLATNMTRWSLNLFLYYDNLNEQQIPSNN